MVCCACGKELAEQFTFCPHCGNAIVPEAPVIAAPESTLAIFPVSAAPTSQAVTPKQGISTGTFVLGGFSLISFVVSVSKGLVPIYLLEAAGWAVAAWYWQRLKTRSNASKAVVAWLAIVIAIGEVVHISSQFESTPKNSPGTISVSPAHLPPGFVPVDNKNATPSNPGSPVDSHLTPNNLDQTSSPGKDRWGNEIIGPAPGASNAVVPPPGFALDCPSSIPAGVRSEPLTDDESPKVVGTDGTLDPTSALDDNFKSILLWDAKLNYENRTGGCLTTAVVELELSHGEKVFKERHGIVFDPLLSPGRTQTVRVKLKVKTPERSEDVALLGWHTIRVTGFKI